ncbi:MAG: YdcF family protein [Acidobacteriota bacterium]
MAIRLSAAPLLNGVARQLIRSEKPVAADLIIALGGDRYCLRERKGTDLYLQGYSRRIIVSGVQYIPGVHTGDWARKYVVSLGVKEDDVIVLRETWNTREEARRLAKLMRDNGWKSALVVTSPYHSRRALYTLEKAAPELRFTSVPVEAHYPEWRPEEWWTRRLDAGMTVREVLAWGNTLIRGWE